ncbi:MAG TPA: c-type cytochrome biogenesis protein CcmI [Rhizomicrobium sp.]|nr:c-type cytochrome biogenesis protein CcmI [Rhizomicrobium sp.]
MMLWVILTVMIALATAGLTIPLVRNYESRRHEQRPTPARTLDILKGQLGELDAQQANNLIAQPEAEALRAEIKRRILAEDHETTVVARPLPAAAMPWMAIGLVAVVAISSTALYALMGHPELTSNTVAAAGAPVQAAGPDAQTQHPMGDVSTMIAGLEARLQQDPNDAQGWQMLGWSYMRTNRPADAARAYGRAVSLDPGNAEYLSAQGEAMVQSEGKVSDEAAAIFRRARKGDANDPRARYFLAIYRDQQGDHRGAMADFIALLKSAPPDAPWAVQVRNYVEDLARDQHIDISSQLPPAPAAPAPQAGMPQSGMPGPTSDQVAAAGQMSNADRQAMIRAMVDKLASELKANPHDTGGWVRLMRARMVLGETDKAAEAYKQAHDAFAGTPAAQAALQEAAKSLGVPGA